jgi:N-glycosylase/DNA lyase
MDLGILLYMKYIDLRLQIDARLKEFENLWRNGSDEDILTEMVFCVCTPQSNAHAGWKAATRLKVSGLLYHGNAQQIAHILGTSGVRFKTNKTRYILEARKIFATDTKKKIASFIAGDIVETRNYLAEHIKGWGYKEASHFLRNIGMGRDICILDRHILRNLVAEGVIPEIPPLKKQTYLDIEKKMKAYAKRKRIPNEALDFVFWYQAKNEIYK